MKNRILILVTLIFSTLVFSHSPLAQGLKRWQDKDGNWHFGDTIPPEYAQEGHEEISKQGLVKEVKERAKTEEEIMEEKRLAAIEKKEQKAAEERARQDRILLDTFSDVEDIEMTRDDKIGAIQSRITLIEKRIEKIQADLNSRIQQAAAQERSGNSPNEALLKDIESLRRQIKTNETAIEDSRKEQDEVRAAYQQDIERFNSLKADGR